MADPEVRIADRGLGLVSSMLATVSVPFIAAGLSPEAHVAAAEGWFAVALATLTWSLACAGIVVLVLRSSFTNMALLSVCVVVLLLSWGFAALLGAGFLDLGPTNTAGESPTAMILGFTAVAMQTLGVVGAFVGGGVGVWLGFRVAPLVEEF